MSSRLLNPNAVDFLIRVHQLITNLDQQAEGHICFLQAGHDLGRLHILPLNIFSTPISDWFCISLTRPMPSFMRLKKSEAVPDGFDDELPEVCSRTR